MKSNSKINQQMEQAAAAWNEQQEHSALMSKIASIGYETQIETADDSYGSEFAGMSYTRYYTHLLPEKDLLYILKRGNHEEIMFMLSRYNRLYDTAETRNDSYLPPAAQALLAQRNQAEEINALRYGFCEAAQEVMFETWPHEQLVAYSHRHGFESKGQEIVLQTWSDTEIKDYLSRHRLNKHGLKRLFARDRHDEIMEYIKIHGLNMQYYPELVKRGNHDEIMAVLTSSKNTDTYGDHYAFTDIMKRANHDEIMETIRRIYSGDFTEEMRQQIWKRGDTEEIALMIKLFELSDSQLDEIFIDIEAGKSNKFFAVFAKNTQKGLPVKYQKRFIKSASTEDFKLYIAEQGFYEEVHPLLLAMRSSAEIRCYIERHKYLSPEAEDLFIFKNPSEDKLYYLQHKPHDTKAFINKLLAARPLDYGLLADIFLGFDVEQTGDETEVELMKSGSPEEIAAYFSKIKVLSRKAFLTLFFRMDTKLFETYLNGRTQFYS